MIGWIPALSTTSLLAFALFLSRSLLITRLQASVESEFNSKIEELKSNLRKKELQFESLRSGALTGMVARQNVLYERQIEATDQLWEAVIDLHRAKPIATSLSIMNIEALAKGAKENPQLKYVFDLIDNGFDLQDTKHNQAELAKPYVSVLAWAYYQAYETALYYSVAQLKVLKAGVEDPKKFMNSESATKLIKTALPHRSDYIDKLGDRSFYYLIDELEGLILEALKSTLEGKKVDAENVQRAADVVTLSEELMSETVNVVES